MISKLYIRNFKSIKEATVDLPFFGAIIGENGAGKTNLLQSLDFIKKMIEGASIRKASRNFGLSILELFNNNDSTDRFRIAVTFSENNDDDRQFLLDVTYMLSDEKEALPKVIVGDEVLYELIGGEKVSIYSRSHKTVTDNNGAELPLDIQDDALALATYRNAKTDFVKSLFANVQVTSNSESEIRESIVALNSDGLSSLLVRMKHESPNDYEKFIQICKKILPTLSKLVEIPSEIEQKNLNENIAKSFLVLLEEKGLSGVLSMRSISAGDLRTLYFLANAMKIRNGSLFIEEIENGIHPKRAYDLLDRLTGISQKRDEQIIFTTHSPSIINRLAAQQVIFVEKENELGSSYKRLNHPQIADAIEKFLTAGGNLTDYIESKL